MRTDFRPFLEKADHKDDLDLLTIKVISFIQDKDNMFESKDNQIEIPMYSSSFTSSSNSSSNSSTSSASSHSPTLKRKKFTKERYDTREVTLLHKEVFTDNKFLCDSFTSYKLSDFEKL